MSTRGWRSLLICAAGLLATTAHGVDLPFKLPSFLQGASAPAKAPTVPAAAPQHAASSAASMAAKSSRGLGDLRPDANCSRPQEGFDVMAKVVEFGGQNARLRLERLVATDFRYDDLTPQDKAMLKYVAYTTVWIPPTLESKLGALYSGLAGNKGDESNSPSARRSRERIELLKGQVKDFPGEIRLLVLRDMPSGASAQAGGLISIAQGFISDLEAQPAARDLILAHELSHVYKRHALKEIQFQLVSSAAGFSIAKKLLGRSVNGNGSNFLTDAFGNLQVGFELVNFVKGLQLTFNRDQELEADACAAVWMKRAKIDTTNAWKAFETVSAAPGSAGNYFDHHPSSKERRARFVAAVARQNSNAPSAPASGPTKQAP